MLNRHGVGWNTNQGVIALFALSQPPLPTINEEHQQNNGQLSIVLVNIQKLGQYLIEIALVFIVYSNSASYKFCKTNGQ